MGAGLSRSMVAQEEKATINHEEAFLPNFQLHILKHVE
jgi:hypothetical protein